MFENQTRGEMDFSVFQMVCLMVLLIAMEWWCCLVMRWCSRHDHCSLTDIIMVVALCRRRRHCCLFYYLWSDHRVASCPVANWKQFFNPHPTDRTQSSWETFKCTNVLNQCLDRLFYYMWRNYVNWKQNQVGKGVFYFRFEKDF